MAATPPYVIAGKQTILTTDQARVTLMTLASGQAIPPHRHSQITDTTFCLEGRAAVRFLDTEETVALSVGQHASVPRDGSTRWLTSETASAGCCWSRDRGTTIFCRPDPRLAVATGISRARHDSLPKNGYGRSWFR